jgi:hypothetical protein
MSECCEGLKQKKFKAGCIDMHNKGSQGQHSIVTDELMQQVDKIVYARHHFIIPELPDGFL